MRTTKTVVKYAYSQDEAAQIMSEFGVTPSQFPALPVNIQIGCMTMRIREEDTIGLGDDSEAGNRFVIRVDGVPIE